MKLHRQVMRPEKLIEKLKSQKFLLRLVGIRLSIDAAAVLRERRFLVGRKIAGIQVSESDVIASGLAEVVLRAPHRAPVR